MDRLYMCKSIGTCRSSIHHDDRIQSCFRKRNLKFWAVRGETRTQNGFDDLDDEFNFSNPPQANVMHPTRPSAQTYLPFSSLDEWKTSHPTHTY